MIDDTTCKALYDSIPNSKYSPADGGYIYPSSTPRSALPVLRLWIGDNAVTIDPDDIGFADLGNGWTFGGFQSRGNLGFSIFGGSVLKSVYAVFDQVSRLVWWVGWGWGADLFGVGTEEVWVCAEGGFAGWEVRVE